MYWHLEYGIWNMEYGIWNMEYGIWNMEYGNGIWNTEWLCNDVVHQAYQMSSKMIDCTLIVSSLG